MWYNFTVRPFVRTSVRVILGLTLLVIAFWAGTRVGVRVATPPLPGAGVPPSDAPDRLSNPLQQELFQQVWMLLERDFYGDSPSEEERLYGVVRGLTQAYGDPNTYFVEPQPRELERDRLRGSFGGVGAYIERDDLGYWLRPMRSSPAIEAGVIEGDRLLAIDGEPVDIDTPIDRVTTLIRGPVGTTVCLRLSRSDPQADQNRLEICVERREVETPSIDWKMIAGPDGTSVGYLRQSIFSERSTAEMEEAVGTLLVEGAEAFVLDLRANPGGLVDAAVGVASLWLDGGAILIEERADGEERVFDAGPGEVAPDMPLVVLVDGGTASASEIVAGVLQERGRAILIGHPTFGKGSVQLIHDLVDESSLHVTTAHWFTPERQPLEGVGLTPDLVTSDGEDPLSRALAYLAE